MYTGRQCDCGFKCFWELGCGSLPTRPPTGHGHDQRRVNNVRLQSSPASSSYGRSSNSEMSRLASFFELSNQLEVWCVLHIRFIGNCHHYALKIDQWRYIKYLPKSTSISLSLSPRSQRWKNFKVYITLVLCMACYKLRLAKGTWQNARLHLCDHILWVKITEMLSLVTECHYLTEMSKPKEK